MEVEEWQGVNEIQKFFHDFWSPYHPADGDPGASPDAAWGKLRRPCRILLKNAPFRQG